MYWSRFSCCTSHGGQDLQSKSFAEAQAGPVAPPRVSHVLFECGVGSSRIRIFYGLRDPELYII